MSGQTPVSVQPGDLFDDVGAAGGTAAHVRTRGWRHDGEEVTGHRDLEAQSLENLSHVVTRDLDPENAFDVVFVERDRRRRRQRALDVEWVTEPLQLGTTLAEDLHETRCGAKGQVRIDASFESIGAFGA